MAEKSFHSFPLNVHCEVWGGNKLRRSSQTSVFPATYFSFSWVNPRCSKAKWRYNLSSRFWVLFPARETCLIHFCQKLLRGYPYIRYNLQVLRLFFLWKNRVWHGHEHEACDNVHVCICSFTMDVKLEQSEHQILCQTEIGNWDPWNAAASLQEWSNRHPNDVSKFLDGDPTILMHNARNS